MLFYKQLMTMLAKGKTHVVSIRKLSTLVQICSRTITKHSYYTSLTHPSSLLGLAFSVLSYVHAGASLFSEP